MACEYFANVKGEEIFQVILQKWDEIKSLLNVLEIPFHFTTFLQKADITLSDVFGRWLRMEKIELKKMIEGDGCESKFSKILSDKLENRKSMIINTPLVLSSVYLDPRYRSELSNNQVKIAKETIYRWYIKIHNLETSTTTESFDNYVQKDSFEEYFVCKEQEQESSASIGQSMINQTTSMDMAQFALLLEKYEKTHHRIHHKTNIHEYWQKHEDERILFKLSRFFHSIPPTQVNVERFFSLLALILTPRRFRLKEKILNDIMIISSNKTLWERVNEEVLKNPSLVDFLFTEGQLLTTQFQ